MAQLGKTAARLHHTALRAGTREDGRFYEDVIGPPLMPNWCESTKFFGKVRTYVHTSTGR